MSGARAAPAGDRRTPPPGYARNAYVLRKKRGRGVLAEHDWVRVMF